MACFGSCALLLHLRQQNGISPPLPARDISYLASTVMGLFLMQYIWKKTRLDKAGLPSTFFCLSFCFLNKRFFYPRAFLTNYNPSSLQGWNRSDEEYGTKCQCSDIWPNLEPDLRLEKNTSKIAWNSGKAFSVVREAWQSVEKCVGFFKHSYYSSLGLLWEQQSSI